MTSEKSPLQNLENLKASYSSNDFGRNKLGFIESFFTPCLKNSTEYWRLSAFYSSEVLIYLLQGMAPFIKNKGKIKLILGCIPEKEFDVSNENERCRLYEENFIQILLNKEEFSTENEKRSKDAAIKLFAWLIDNNRLELKLGFIINEEQKIAKKEEIIVALKEGMLHDKIGIFFDETGEKIGFRGSLNETVKALKNHNEGIDVHKSWQKYEGDLINKHLAAYIQKFEKLWNNDVLGIRIYSLPNDLIKRISSRSPKSYSKEELKQDCEIIEDFYMDYILESIKLNDDFKPFRNVIWKNPPQVKSYEKWILNKRKGIMEIATGVGKTLIGIRGIYEFLKEEPEGEEFRTVIIAVHNKQMINQWKDEIDHWLTDPRDKSNIARILDIKGGRGRNSISQQIQDLKAFSLPYEKKLIIISHYEIISSKLISVLKIFEDNRKILFIADEVHEMGTKKRLERFSQFFPDYRLGLSATPDRYFDFEGSEELKSYFKGEEYPSGVIYQYLISEAIRDEFLCPYEYHPILTLLNEDETIKYIKLTKLYMFAKNEEHPDYDKLEILARKRKRIIKKANSKIPLLIELIGNIRKQCEIEGLKYLLIYLEDSLQLISLRNELIENDYSVDFLISGKIQSEPVKQNRDEIIRNFQMGDPPILLAIRILDQGVNIPELRYAILVSSTGNKKQYIQRRGRLLRIDNKTGKKVAKIYDLVIPYYLTKKKVNNSFETVKVPIKSEMKRLEIFFEDCLNKENVRRIKEKWRNKNVE